MSLPNGAAGPSMTWKWSTCGWMESTSRLVLRRRRRRYWWRWRLLSDGMPRCVVSAVPGYRESTENWSEVLRDIKRRGLSCPRLVVGDGHLGISPALAPPSWSNRQGACYLSANSRPSQIPLRVTTRFCGPHRQGADDQVVGDQGDRDHRPKAGGRRSSSRYCTGTAPMDSDDDDA